MCWRRRSLIPCFSMGFDTAGTLTDLFVCLNLHQQFHLRTCDFRPVAESRLRQDYLLHKMSINTSSNSALDVNSWRFVEFLTILTILKATIWASVAPLHTFPVGQTLALLCAWPVRWYLGNLLAFTPERLQLCVGVLHLTE